MRSAIGSRIGSGAPLTPMFATFDALVAWLASAPAGTMIDAAALRAVLATIADARTPNVEPSPVVAPGATWSERLWVVAPETRLGVREAAEALGRPLSFVYRHTSAKAAGADRLPHKKFDGELLFVAGELREWIRAHEETVVQGAPSSTLALRRA